MPRASPPKYMLMPANTNQFGKESMASAPRMGVFRKDMPEAVSLDCMFVGSSGIKIFDATQESRPRKISENL